MVKRLTADILDWTERAKRNATLVIREASSTVFDSMTERQASAAERGGPPQEGKVPVDTGFLIGSQTYWLNGAQISSGDVIGYELVISQLEAGDVMVGGFTADYAIDVEYGRDGYPGAFFVRGAAAQWQEAVRDAARRVSQQ